MMILLNLNVYSQDLNPVYLKFLPSNVNPSEIKSSDIPSEQVLRQMGLSDEEVSQALDFKYQRGLYENTDVDTISSFKDKIQKFYMNMGDLSYEEDTLTFPKAKIYGQHIFRTNDINYFQRSSDVNAPGNYELGAGDQLSISVWGRSDYSDLSTVDEKGYIHPSGFGRIYVKGLTFAKAKSLIRNRLGMNDSDMEITLIYSRVILVNIVGEVYNPGSYAIPAINTAFNALMASKGPTQIGSVRNIYIKRDGLIIDSLDVYKFLFNPSRHNDLYLQDGDYIIVSSASNLVEVKGEVNRPYTYEIKKSDNVYDVVKYAGGYTPFASKNIITLKRFDKDRFLIHDVHKNDLRTTYLESADEITVNKIQSKSTNYITLEGTVGVEGDYEFIEGENILELLQRSSCLNDYLYTDYAYISRLNKDRTRTHISINLSKVINDPKHKENLKLQEFDIVRVMSVDDFDDNYIVSVFGSVRNPGDHLYGDGLLLKDVLILSGGINQEASGSRVEVSRVLEIEEKTILPKRSVVLTANINDDLTLKMEESSFRLQPNDQVFVRKNPSYREPINVFVSGEVQYPGMYALLSEGEKISQIIKRSGGVTDYAFLTGSKLYRKVNLQEKEYSQNLVSERFKEFIFSDTQFNKYNENLFEREMIKYSSAGIIKVPEYSLVSFDLNKALSNKGSKHNLVLHPGDSLVIPKLIDVVYLTGDLFNYEADGINVPYFPSKRADYYINNFAGGYSKQNDKTRTVVIYPNGSVKRSINMKLFRISPKVKRGSTIKIIAKEEYKTDTKIKPIDWNLAIEHTITKITAVMSLYLLIERIDGSF